MVPEDSSAARMPRPGATMASATLLSSARFIAVSVVLQASSAILPSLQANGKGRMASPLMSAVIISTIIVPPPDPQHLDARQGLALEPLEKGAAGGRDIGEALGHAGR